MEWGFNIHWPARLTEDQIPDKEFYRPYNTGEISIFSPWLGFGSFHARYLEIQPYTLVSADRCHVLFTLAAQAAGLDGQWYECGVYRGGTAMMLSRLLAEHPKNLGIQLHLFDTFEGMPQTNKDLDYHVNGDFADCSADALSERLGKIAPHAAKLHPGLIPDTFSGLEDHRIAFAHVDVDIFQSILDCCEFIYPRLVPGAFIVFDDYGFTSCPGARKAVDLFFADKPEHPLVLPTGQAIVFKCR